ncbi:MAG: hypothetical protein ACFE9Z_13080 [Promethearchaeota archaeon]
MEKIEGYQTPKKNLSNNKDKLGSKIESLWADNLLKEKKDRFESRKLKIKLETNGIERNKIFLKLESNSNTVQCNNFNLISELLKEFFNGKQNFE